MAVTIYAPVEEVEAMLTARYRTDPTTVELALCDSASWSSPPTQAEVVASIIADQNGYTKQDVTPTADASTSSNTATVTFADATITLTSSTLNYTGYCILIDSTRVVFAQKYDTTQTIDSAGSGHQFNGTKYSIEALTA